MAEPTTSPPLSTDTTSSITTSSTTTSLPNTSTTSTTTTSDTTTPQPDTSTTTSTTTGSSTTTTGLPTTTTSGTSSSTSTTTTALPTTTFTTPVVRTTTGSTGPVTITSVITTTSRGVAPTSTSQDSNSGSSGFFNNTGAVAGVFTVVGLVVLAIFIAIITNTIRRRRAKKFDREIAEAARDAANTQVPNFYDDDYQPGYGQGGGGKYSDVSHGTYAQPPMAPASAPESYGMRELGSGPAPGEYFDAAAYSANASSAGAAGIGVARARSTTRDGGYAAGLQEGAAPYAAFVVPGAGAAAAVGAPYPPGMIRGAGSPEFDVTPGPHRRPSQYNQQTEYANLSRNKSVTSAENTGSTGYYGSSSASASSGNPQHPPQDQYYNQSGYPNSFGAYTAPTTSNPPPPIPTQSTEDLDAAYGGYVVDEEPQLSGHLPNPYPAQSKPTGYEEESDDEQPQRVLKVANQ